MTTQTETRLRIPEWTFGDRLRKIRLEVGIDQREFAERLNVKAPTYAAYETGRATPRFKDVFEFAAKVQDVSGISASWLIGQPSDYKATVHAMFDRPRGRRDSTGPGRRAA